MTTLTITRNNNDSNFNQEKKNIRKLPKQEMNRQITWNMQSKEIQWNINPSSLET